MLDYVRKWDPHGHHNNTTISSCNTFAPGVFYNLIMQRFLLYTCIVGSSLCHMRFAFSFFVDQFFDFIIQQTSQQTSYPHQPPSIQKMQHCPVGFVCSLVLICLNDKYNCITSKDGTHWSIVLIATPLRIVASKSFLCGTSFTTVSLQMVCPRELCAFMAVACTTWLLCAAMRWAWYTI